MKFKLGFVLGALVVVAVITNPKEEQHAKTIAEDALSPFASEGNGTLAKIGGAFADAFSGTIVDYHNYGVMSTTTSPGSDETLSIGAFGIVHVTEN